MFRPKNRKRKRQTGTSARQKPSRRLFLESLESRRLLAGVVDLSVAAGSLTLTGNVSNNHVEVLGTAVPGQFDITGKSGTVLTLEGGLQTFTTLQLNGITDDIFAVLGHGQDTFELGASDTPVKTKVGFNVDITNEDDDTNIITNVDIGEDLIVSRGDAAYSELAIDTTNVRGDASIDNGDGDTKTEITDSEIEGLLTITNGDGDDYNKIERTSIGAALFVRPGDIVLPAIPVVSISNGQGGSLTSFTAGNDPDSTGTLPSGQLGRPTVFGGIDIANGDALPPGLEVPPPIAGGSTPDELRTAVDIAVFDQVEVLGHLDISNDDGHTEIVIVDSHIGTDTKNSSNDPVNGGGYGEAVTIENGDGYDVFLMDNSSAPYGLSIVNASVATDTRGSQADIRDSEIGTRMSPTLGAALIFSGDDGDDVFNIVDTTAAGTEIGGAMILSLYDGDDSVMIHGLPGTIEIGSLMITGSEGDDMVSIQNTKVDSMVMIELTEGADTLEIRSGVTFPSALVGTILLDGGIGADFYHIDDPLLPFLSFEILIP